jgi:hypothetical protein
MSEVFRKIYCGDVRGQTVTNYQNILFLFKVKFNELRV